MSSSTLYAVEVMHGSYDYASDFIFGTYLLKEDAETAQRELAEQLNAALSNATSVDVSFYDCEVYIREIHVNQFPVIPVPVYLYAQPLIDYLNENDGIVFILVDPQTGEPQAASSLTHPGHIPDAEQIREILNQPGSIKPFISGILKQNTDEPDSHYMPGRDISDYLLPEKSFASTDPHLLREYIKNLA
jgi:hypothetical protein